MKAFISVIAFIAVTIFLYLTFLNKNWESIAALIGSIVVFLTSLTNIYASKRTKNISQHIGNNSIGIQAGGNVKISNNKENK